MMPLTSAHDDFLESELLLISQGTHALAAAVVWAARPAIKTYWVNCIRRLRPQLKQILYRAIATSPHEIWDLLRDFRGTVRILYFGLRCVALGRRRLHPAHSHGDMTDDERDRVIGRDSVCAVSRMGEPSVTPDLAHVIPHALGKYFDWQAIAFL
jgi:hypothetical protein